MSATIDPFEDDQYCWEASLGDEWEVNDNGNDYVICVGYDSVLPDKGQSWTFLRHLNPIGPISRRDFPGSLPVICRDQRSRRSVLLAESHRFDVSRCIDVSIMGRPTRDTGPLAVGEGQLGVDMATVRAHLGRGLKPTNHLDILAVPLGLILDLAAQFAPASIHDRPIHGATPRGVSNHRRNRQILDTERGGLVLAHQMTADLVEVVVSDVGNGFVGQGDPQARFLPVLGPLDLTRQATLSNLEAALIAFQDARVSESFALGCDHKVFETEVETESLGFVKGRQRGLGNPIIDQNRGVEFARGGATDCGRLDLALKSTIETPSNTLTEFYDLKPLSVKVQLGVLRELKRLVAIMSRFEYGESPKSFEKSSKSRVKIAKSALKRGGGNLSKPFSILPFFQVGQMALKFVDSYVCARFHIAARFFRKSPVVDPASAAEVFSQQFGLSWGGVKAVFVSAEHGHMELHGFRRELYKNRYK